MSCDAVFGTFPADTCLINLKKSFEQIAGLNPGYESEHTGINPDS